MTTQDPHQRTMENPKKAKPTQGSPDFTLLLNRIEKKVLESDDLSVCVKTLARRDVWTRLGEAHQLQWAKLAQMAGIVDTALEILGHINRVHPACVEAWTERLDLLSILDRREEMAQVLGQARRVIGEERCRPWLKGAEKLLEGGDRDIDAAVAPFERLQHRHALITRYLDLFSGREDCFARQWSDKQEGKQGYVPIRRPMEFGDVEDHLSGRKTYGIYLLRSDATVKTAVIDIDIAKKFRSGKLTADEKRLILRERDFLLSRINELGNAQGLKPIVEFSGGVLDFLIKNRTETVFITPTGRFRARLAIDEHRHVSLRKAQYLRLSETGFSLDTARRIVRGKIDNILRFVQVRSKNYSNALLRMTAAQLKAVALSLDRVADMDRLRGMEGIAARIYFRSFGKLIRNDAFWFAKRNRRPPLDPVNALLSFVYTLLTNEVLSAVKAVGLDP